MAIGGLPASKRKRRFLLYHFHGEAGSHVVELDTVDQSPVKCIELLRGTNLDFQQIIDLACQAVHFNDLRQFSYDVMKRLKPIRPMPRRLDRDKERFGEANLLRIEQNHLSENYPFLLQTLDSVPNGRLRNPDFFGQPVKGKGRIHLHEPKNIPIDIVKRDRRSIRSTLIGQMFLHVTIIENTFQLLVCNIVNNRIFFYFPHQQI